MFKKIRMLGSCLMIALYAAPAAKAEVLGDMASPVTTPARTWLIAGTSLTALLLIFEDQVIDPTQRELVESRPLGRFTKIGDYAGRVIPNGLYAGGMFLASALGNEKAGSKARVMLLGTIYSASVATALKYSVREPRPNNGADRKSFPSGHTTTAFVFASVVGAEDGWKWGIPAYALAGLVAYSRMNDNQHYVHDVVAGATIGVVYGLGIHYLHGKDSKGSLVAVLPLWEGEAKGLSMALRF